MTRSRLLLLVLGQDGVTPGNRYSPHGPPYNREPEKPIGEGRTSETGCSLEFYPVIPSHKSWKT